MIFPVEIMHQILVHLSKIELLKNRVISVQIKSIIEYILLHCDNDPSRIENETKALRKYIHRIIKCSSLDIIRILNRRGILDHLWDSNMYSVLAVDEKYEIIKWLFKHQYSETSGLCEILTCKRNLKMLKWLYYKGVDISSSVCVLAAKYGYTEIFSWAIQKSDSTWKYSRTICAYAAGSGNIEILKLARENGCYWNENTCAYAAAKNHFKILKWAQRNGCPWNELTCLYAAHHGHFEILKWAVENGCPLGSSSHKVFNSVVKRGDLDLLKWLETNGCYGNDDTCQIALEYRQHDIYHWALNNGYSYKKRIIYEPIPNLSELRNRNRLRFGLQ